MDSVDISVDSRPIYDRCLADTWPPIVHMIRLRLLALTDGRRIVNLVKLGKFHRLMANGKSRLDLGVKTCDACHCCTTVVVLFFSVLPSLCSLFYVNGALRRLLHRG